MITIETVEPLSGSVAVPLWAWVAAALVVLALVAMLQAQVSGVHEFVHDARHFVGVPCH